MTKILIDLATVQQALVTLENVNPSLVCEMAHHVKKDQHGVGQKCPLEIRHLETITAIKEVLAQQPLPVQEPWGACVSGRVFVGALPEHVRKLTEDDGLPIQLLYTAPQRKPLTDDVLVPLEVLEAAASSLDSFCGNLGWGDADLQNMDNLFAVIEQHKAAHGIKENT